MDCSRFGMADGRPRSPVLLVDDRPANLLALEALLQSEGCDLVKAFSGFKAIELVAQTEFAAVILDLQMPGIDGFETARRIKRLPLGKDVPIIFVTAAHRDEEVRRGYAAGGLDFFTKPLDGDLLRRKVRIYTELYAKDRLLRGPGRRDAPAGPPLDVLLVDDDEGEARLFMAACKACAPSLEVRHLSDGLKAVDALLHERSWRLPDLLILDLQMPRMSGFEVLAELKVDGAMKRLPVIVFSTSDNPADVLRAYNLGANCYISKPLGFDRLCHLARTLVLFWRDLASLPSSRARTPR